jgi:hypothetical protein
VATGPDEILAMTNNTCLPRRTAEPLTQIIKRNSTLRQLSFCPETSLSFPYSFFCRFFAHFVRRLHFPFIPSVFVEFIHSYFKVNLSLSLPNIRLFYSLVSPNAWFRLYRPVDGIKCTFQILRKNRSIPKRERAEIALWYSTALLAE